MDGSEIVNMVSSSLAAVMKQSLNPTFRRECQLLLKVTNNKDAKSTMQYLLEEKLSKSKCPSDANSNSTSESLITDCGKHKLSQCFASNGVDGESLVTEVSSAPSCSYFSSSETTVTFETSPSDEVLMTQQNTDSSSDDETQLDWDVAS